MTASTQPNEEYKELLHYMAEVIYEAIRAYELAVGITDSPKWDDLGKDAVEEWVMIVDSKMGSAMSAEQEHSLNRSMEAKSNYKDQPKRSSLKPWSELPERLRVERCLINTLVKVMTQE